MTYDEAYAYIEKVGRLGSVYGLDNIKELLRRLDNPQDKLKIIHIAGTNGKGSICAFLEKILRDAGYTVGRYISPVIFEYRERFQMDGQYISEEEFAGIMDKVVKCCYDMEEEGFKTPTAFETETAVAFMYFLERKADVVLLETGMGGKNDATNVIKKPVCTVFSSISMDHMAFLGNTLTEIFEEKCGIMKKNTPSVAYMLPDELKVAWLKKCENMNCEPVMPDISQFRILKCNVDGSSFLYKNKEYKLSTLGIYQIYNAITAIETAELLNRTADSDIALNYVNVYNGLKKTIWEGRFQKTCDNPPIYVDGAHNVGGWESLKLNIETYFPDNYKIFICGVFADKEYEKMVDIMYPYADAVITVTPDNPRALPKENLARLFGKHIEHVYTADSVLAAKDMAVNMAHEHVNKDESYTSVIIAFGSLSFIGPLIR